MIVVILINTLMIIEQLKLSRPSPDDLGYVDSIAVEEIGGVTVSKISFFLFFFLVNYYLPFH